ncbi:MAG TPA: BamA/TamA family outer membrane protein [Planctomycetota bacterium]
MKRLLLLSVLAGCASTEPEAKAAGDPRFVFEGANAISESRLRDLVASDLARYLEDKRPAPLQDAVFRMVNAYGLAGYADAAVDVEEAPDKVYFRIREGGAYLLGRVHFRGNVHLKDRELEGVEPGALPGSSLPFSERLLARIRADLLAIYRAKGFIDAVVKPPLLNRQEDGERVHVTFQIEEGLPYVIEAIEGASEAAADLIGTPFASGSEGVVEARVTDLLREKGRPFARAQATATLDRLKGRARIKVEVQPGPTALLGELDVESKLRTRESFIRARAGLPTGEPFSASKLAEAEKRLLSTGLFSTARLDPDEGGFENGQVPVVARLEEREPGEVAVKLGYGTLDGERIGLDLSYDNVFGGAELVRVGGTLGRFGRRADGEFALRYFLGTDLRPGVNAFYELRDYPSFEAASYGGEASLSYDFGHGLHASLGLLRSIIRTTDVEEGVPPGDLLDFEYTALFAAAGWDGRDVPHLPTRGTFLGGRVEWSDRPLESELRFVNFNGRAAAYVPLPWDLVGALSLQGGRIRPLDTTDEIPIALRYFAGGLTTVRGFEFASIGPEVDDDPTGGQLFLALQAELRFPIWGGLHGAVFHDRGGVWFEYDDFDVDDIRWSVGTGIRYYTPAGALVLDVGWNPDREEGEHAVEAHISVGFPF